MVKTLERITKYNRPTSYDHAPYGQLWTAELEDGVEHYIQTSSDENHPAWQELGAFFVQALLPQLQQHDIVKYLIMHENNLKAQHDASDSTLRPWS